MEDPIDSSEPQGLGVCTGRHDLAMGPAPNSLTDGKTMPVPVPARLVQPAGQHRAGVPNM